VRSNLQGPCSGLTIAVRRFYGSNLARWINRDPIEEMGGLNLYGYILNEPTTKTDSTGLDGWGSGWLTLPGPFVPTPILPANTNPPCKHVCGFPFYPGIKGAPPPFDQPSPWIPLPPIFRPFAPQLPVMPLQPGHYDYNCDFPGYSEPPYYRPQFDQVPSPNPFHSQNPWGVNIPPTPPQLPGSNV
jgi:RHS repeat-associated protein